MTDATERGGCEKDSSPHRTYPIPREGETLGLDGVRVMVIQPLHRAGNGHKTGEPVMAQQQHAAAAL
ncbi:hypothetical protein VTH06DRAFT_1656 [Thermothelomyces fergusii]